jgi:antitoxin component of MazEF toxin-antitoxin module
MTSMWKRIHHGLLRSFWGRPVRFDKGFLCRGSSGNAIAEEDNLRGAVRVIGDDVQLKVFEQAFFFSPERARNLADLLLEAATVAASTANALETARVKEADNGAPRNGREKDMRDAGLTVAGGSLHQPRR